MPARFALRVFSFEVPMPVPSTINDLSTVANDNYPKGNENPFPLNDDHIRAHASFIAALREGKLDASAVSAFMLTVLNDADAATARTTLGAASLGSNTFSGAQTLPGNAVNELEAVPKQQLDGVLTTYTPTLTFGGTVAPTEVSVYGEYRVVGKLVVCSFSFQLTKPSTAGGQTCWLSSVSLPIPARLIKNGALRNHKRFLVLGGTKFTSYVSTDIHICVIDQATPSELLFGGQYDPQTGAGTSLILSSYVDPTTFYFNSTVTYEAA